MPGNKSDKSIESPIRHTGGFVEGAQGNDPTTSFFEETAHGEDWTTTSNIIAGLIHVGIDIETANTVLAPRVVAGIRSERDYRRDCHRSLKEIGYDAGRALYSGVVDHEDAAGLLEKFIEADTAGVGLELGHIEFFGHTSPLGALSVHQAWKHLDTMGENIVNALGYEVIDAHKLPVSHRAAVFTGEYKVKDETKEIKLPRARSNSPVLDIGRTGIQLFVRMAVGYETTDRDEDRTLPTLRDLRKAHLLYMHDHTREKGITMLGEKTFSYPIAGTLVAYKREEKAA